MRTGHFADSEFYLKPHPQFNIFLAMPSVHCSVFTVHTNDYDDANNAEATKDRRIKGEFLNGMAVCREANDKMWK